MYFETLPFQASVPYKYGSLTYHHACWFDRDSIGLIFVHFEVFKCHVLDFRWPDDIIRNGQEAISPFYAQLDDTGETRRTISWQSVYISWCFYYKSMMLILWWLWLMQRTPHAVMVNRHSCRLNNCSICLPATTTHTISHKITVYVITIRWCLLAGILVYVGPDNIYFFMHDAIAS